MQICVNNKKKKKKKENEKVDIVISKIFSVTLCNLQNILHYVFEKWTFSEKVSLYIQKKKIAFK